MRRRYSLLAAAFRTAARACHTRCVDSYFLMVQHGSRSQHSQTRAVAKVDRSQKSTVVARM
eukprot:4649940-Prymnesium_polylepis.2